nr:hypothetical protein Itr_chr01CG08980 [Ipomoea trifida]
MNFFFTYCLFAGFIFNNVNDDYNPLADDDLCVVISDGNGEVGSVQSTFMQKADSGASFPATRAGFPTPLLMTTSDRKRGTTDNGAAFR